MTAYNKYNGIPCTVHPVLREVTMKDWGLRGIITTDGGAFKQLLNTHAYYPSLDVAAAECIKAGITMFLDDYRASVVEALDKGLVTEKEIEKAIYGNFRVLLNWDCSIILQKSIFRNRDQGYHCSMDQIGSK